MSKLPNGWIEMIAEEYCDRVSDGTHDSPKKREQGKLLITSKNIKNGSLEKSSAYNISIEDYIEVNKRSNVDKWDILLSMIGTVGEVCIIKEEPDFAIKNVGLFKCSNKTDSYWLYYYLRSKFGKNYILSRLSGTTQKYITLGDLRKFPIFSPKNFEEQKAIVDVLSSLDEKIELLQEENKTLEELAQTMFKEWFVNFNYHGATGEMEDSELGEIPKGWRVGKLGEVCLKISKGTTPRKNAVEGLKSEIPFLKVKDLTDNGRIKFNALEKIPNEIHNKSLKRSKLEVNDILFSIAGTIGRVVIVPEELDDSNCNQAIAFIRLSNKENYLEYVHQWIKMVETQFEIKSNIVQGVQANVSLTVLGNLKIIIPNILIMTKWKALIKPIYYKVTNNINQIQTLSHTKDILLPKLMSGEIRVEGFGE